MIIFTYKSSVLRLIFLGNTSRFFFSQLTNGEPPRSPHTHIDGHASEFSIFPRKKNTASHRFKIFDILKQRSILSFNITNFNVSKAVALVTSLESVRNKLTYNLEKMHICITMTNAWPKQNKLSTKQPTVLLMR